MFSFLCPKILWFCYGWKESLSERERDRGKERCLEWDQWNGLIDDTASNNINAVGIFLWAYFQSIISLSLSISSHIQMIWWAAFCWAHSTQIWSLQICHDNWTLLFFHLHLYHKNRHCECLATYSKTFYRFIFINWIYEFNRKNILSIHVVSHLNIYKIFCEQLNHSFWLEEWNRKKKKNKNLKRSSVNWKSAYKIIFVVNLAEYINIRIAMFCSEIFHFSMNSICQ